MAGIRGGDGRYVKLVGDWSKAFAILSAAPSIVDHALETAVKQEAEHLVGEMKKSFRNIKPALSSSTLLTKRMGGSKPLQRSGDLRGSIKVEEGIDGPASAFIGILRSNAQGTKLALIHEFGKTIVQRMTRKQQRFIHANLPRLPEASKGAVGGTGVIVIHIPARPFIRPVLDREGPKIPDRFAARVVKLIDAGIAASGGGGSTPKA